MPRPPRAQPIDIPLHIIGRGCRGIPVLGDDDSRGHFVYLLNEVVKRYEWRVLDWVLMSNHHHLVVSLREQNLDAGMHRLHALHADQWNRRHASMGHVWMRRYSSTILDSAEYLENVMRYVAWNPVSAGLCAEPEQWKWGGCAANAGVRLGQPFHDVPLGRGVFRDVFDSDASTAESIACYRGAVLTGNADLVVRSGVESTRPPLDEIITSVDSAAITRAAKLWGYTNSEIAAHCGVNEKTVRRRKLQLASS
jgi:REP element-mobilizing transposase RayT